VNDTKQELHKYCIAENKFTENTTFADVGSSSAKEVATGTGTFSSVQETVSSMVRELGVPYSFTREDFGFEQFFKRPIQCDSFTWQHSLAQNSIALVDVLHSYFGAGAVVAKLANFVGLHGEMVIRLVHNGSPFQMGLLAIAPIILPGVDITHARPGGYNTNWGYAHLGQIISNPFCVKLTPGVSNEIEITIPFMQFASYYDKAATGIVQLAFCVIVPVTNIDYSTTTDVNVNTYVYFRNAKPVKPSIAQSERDPTATNRLQSTGLSEAIRGAGRTLSMYANSLTAAIELGANVANAMGFSKPSMGEPANMVFNRYVSNPAFNGLDQSNRMVNDVNQSVGVSAAALGFGADDDSEFKKIAKVYGIVQDWTWNTTDGAHHMVGSSTVDPLLRWTISSTPGARSFIPTPMAYCAIPFEAWHGNITFCVEVVCTPFHKGSLRLFYDPAATSAPTSGQYSESVPYVIIDVAGPRCYEFRCDWFNASPIAFLTTSQTDFTSGTPLGYFGVSVESPLIITNAGTSAPVHVILYAKCDNLRLFSPNVNLSELAFVSSNAQSAVVMDDKLIGSIFGEEVTNFRQLAKKSSVNAFYQVTGGTAQKYSNLVAVLPNFPIAPNILQGSPPVATVINPVAGATNTNYMNFLCTYVGYAAIAFYARRGGTRVKAFAAMYLDAGPRFECVMKPTIYLDRIDGDSLYFAQQAGVQSVTLKYLPMKAFRTGLTLQPLTTVSSSSEPVFEFEIPSRTVNTFMDARNQTGSYVAQVQASHIMILPYASSDGTTTGTPPTVAYEYSAADDFSVNMFMGSPYFLFLSCIRRKVCLLRLRGESPLR